MFYNFLKGYRKGLSDLYHKERTECDSRGGAVFKKNIFIRFYLKDIEKD